MTLQETNQKRWENCKVYSSKGPTFEKVANRLMAPEAKARYQAVEKSTGVPWWFTAVVHEREASQRWNTQLGQGDPLNRVSTHVPKGRGPFNTWEDGAYDALVKCAPYASKNKDWSPGGALTMLEKYNGLGYANKGRPSPYIWAGTNQYSSGKYVADGVYDPNAVDSQLGCAGLLKFMDVWAKPTSVPSIYKKGTNFMLNILSMFIGPDKVGGWVRAAVASALTAAVAKYGFSSYLSTDTILVLAAAVGTAAGGIWSTIAKTGTVAVPEHLVVNPNAPVDERIPVNTKTIVRTRKVK